MKSPFVKPQFLLPLSLLLGGLCGFFHLPFIPQCCNFFIDIFLSALKLLSLPMIFLAIVSTASQISGLKEAKSLLGKILKYTLLTTLLASVIGWLLFYTIQPVRSLGEGITGGESAPRERYFSFLKKMIPSNLVEPFLESNVLGVACIGIVLSIALLYIPQEKSQSLKGVFEGLWEAVLKIASALITFMPLAIFAFAVQLMEHLEETKQELHHLFFYALCILLANVIQGIVVLPLLLKWKGIPFYRTVKAMGPALAMAFFSKSSSATLPLTLECAKTRLGVSDKVSKLTLPLCSIINMNGCAAFILITFLFVSHQEGLYYSMLGATFWIFMATLAAIGNAAVPMGCYFLTSALLAGMGIPLKTMGLILPLYPFFDMVETALNVWSDSCVTALVDQEVKEEGAFYLPKGNNV